MSSAAVSEQAESDEVTILHSFEAPNTIVFDSPKMCTSVSQVSQRTRSANMGTVNPKAAYTKLMKGKASKIETSYPPPAMSRKQDEASPPCEKRRKLDLSDDDSPPMVFTFELHDDPRVFGASLAEHVVSHFPPGLLKLAELDAGKKAIVSAFYALQDATNAYSKVALLMRDNVDLDGQLRESLAQQEKAKVEYEALLPDKLRAESENKSMLSENTKLQVELSDSVSQNLDFQPQLDEYQHKEGYVVVIYCLQAKLETVKQYEAGNVDGDDWSKEKLEEILNNIRGYDLAEEKEVTSEPVKVADDGNAASEVELPDVGTVILPTKEVVEEVMGNVSTSLPVEKP